ncbi:hypothetical protein M8C21_021122 [Ambrosia artemisiifolia]|uniref:Uncharacterized protein n=1 Tax=Ambrosia artemisiifolia TaxID=4212 RepID=A0AAD5BY29_AMBAR|nr:hypothetical protein M8C21_021122 [Ambrosia artemisiifolia]
MLETPYPAPTPGRPPNAKYNPLFDPYRNVAHIPPTILDLNYRGTESGANCVDQISVNLTTMYTQMIADTTANPDAFFRNQSQS